MILKTYIIEIHLVDLKQRKLLQKQYTMKH